MPRCLSLVSIALFTMGTVACSANTDSTPDDEARADEGPAESSSEALTSAVKSTSCVLPGIPSANMLSAVIQNCHYLGYKYVDDYGYPNGWMTYGCGIMGPYNQQSHRLFYQCYK